MANTEHLFFFFSQAYVFDVEDEYAESDIPTTLIRSKADCPGIEVSYFLVVMLFVFVCAVLKCFSWSQFKSDAIFMIFPWNKLCYFVSIITSCAVNCHQSRCFPAIQTVVHSVLWSTAKTNNKAKNTLGYFQIWNSLVVELSVKAARCLLRALLAMQLCYCKLVNYSIRLYVLYFIKVSLCNGNDIFIGFPPRLKQH